MASWAVYLFVLYIYVVGSSIYRLFYPTQCPAGAPVTFCVHPLVPSGAFAAAVAGARVACV